jgi:hypothetical protein
VLRFNLRATQVLTRTDGGKLAAASGQKSSSSKNSCSRPFCTQCRFDIGPSEGMHVGDRQGHPFLAGAAAPYLAAFRKGSLKPALSRATTSQLMPTTRKQPSDWQSWPLIWFFAGWPSSRGALRKWFVKSALSLGDFRTYRDNSTMQYLKGIVSAAHDLSGLGSARSVR